MSEHMMKATGEIIWTELCTHDPEAAARFYGATLGWEIEAMEMGRAHPYRIASVGGNRVCGIFGFDPAEGQGETTPLWVTYFSVGDVDAKLTEMVEAGGSVARPPFDVPGVGRLALVADTEGVVFGLFAMG